MESLSSSYLTSRLPTPAKRIIQFRRFPNLVRTFHARAKSSYFVTISKFLLDSLGWDVMWPSHLLQLFENFQPTFQSNSSHVNTSEFSLLLSLSFSPPSRWLTLIIKPDVLSFIHMIYLYYLSPSTRLDDSFKIQACFIDSEPLHWITFLIFGHFLLWFDFIKSHPPKKDHLMFIIPIFIKSTFYYLLVRISLSN